MSISLSAEQNKHFDDIMKWFYSDSSEQSFVLAGYAGTGKTTLASYIANEVGVYETAFCAYTGKAANVLREKGNLSAATIHSYLYAPTKKGKKVIEKLEGKLAAAQGENNSAEVARLGKLLKAKTAEMKQPQFRLNSESTLKDMKLTIVDEYSMLDAKIRADLHKTCKKILYLGDPFQLPPVNGECDLKPNAFMTEIHRQALDNPIIRASKAIREGRNIPHCNLPGFAYLPRHKAATELFTKADQVIVGRNNTRQIYNSYFRKVGGFSSSPLPLEGEKVICLKNNHRKELFNGMIETTNRDSKPGKDYFMMGIPEHPELRVWNGDIRGKSKEYNHNDPFLKTLERFDFAYAITCHKSQGSEFDNVLVYNEPVGQGVEAQRWLYTAITRGKVQVNLVDPK